MDYTEIIDRVRERFIESMADDDRIASLEDLVEMGKATYEDAHRFASIAGQKMGSILADELVGQEISGTLSLDMLRDVLPRSLWTNYDQVSTMTEQIQQGLNEAAHIGIKAVVPRYDRQRVYGLADEVARLHEEDGLAAHVDTFLEQVENLSLHIVDESVRDNAELQYESGMSPKIVRKISGKACDICKRMAGTYDYYKDIKFGEIGNDVFLRHTNCRCIVTYNPGDGRAQDVHSKRWYTEEEAENIRRRRASG